MWETLFLTWQACLNMFNLNPLFLIVSNSAGVFPTTRGLTWEGCTSAVMPRIVRGSETTQGVLATRLGPLADPILDGWSFPYISMGIRKVSTPLHPKSGYICYIKTRLVVGEVCGSYVIMTFFSSHRFFLADSMAPKAKSNLWKILHYWSQHISTF